MTTQGNTTTRPFVWEDEAPAEPRIRRVQQGVSLTGRALPGMPLEKPAPDNGDPSRTEWERPEGGPLSGQRVGSPDRDWPDKDWPKKPWWRPESAWGRAFLGFGALMILGGLLTCILLFKTMLERDARFRIEGAGNIQASGLTQVSRAEMLPVFGEDIGRNVFFVPLAERRKQLEAIPWIERATVMRLLPGEIRVSVVERQPVAFTRQGNQVGLVDASGVLLTMPAATMAKQHYSFPVLTGIDPRDPLTSRKARMAVYLRLLAELDANSQHYSQQISEIDLTDPEDARVLMPEQGEDILAHFGEERFLERYQRYKAHIAEWRQQYPKLRAVDLRYDQQVVLEMAPGTNAVQAAVGDESAADANKEKPAVKRTAGKRQIAVEHPAKHSAGAKQPAEKRAAEGGGGFNPRIEPAKSTRASAPEGFLSKNSPAIHPSSASSNAKSRTTAAKDKAARDAKKRFEAKRNNLNASKRKPAPTTRPAAISRQGQ